MTLAPLPAVKAIELADLSQLAAIVATSTEPLVFKGLCRHWPLVQAGLTSDQAAADYLRQFDQGLPITACRVPAAAKGRVFYNDDLSGFNYQAQPMGFSQLLETLLAAASDSASAADCWYMGSTEVEQWFSGLATDNSFQLAGISPLTSLWLGGPAVIAAHFDFPHNLACNLVGQRTFTLFPPEQISNLYVGPMEFAPGGQDISLVDFQQVDWHKFPKFAKAWQAAQQAVLAPGDVLFIPSMWWHHVQANAGLNALITHWWRDTPGYLGRPTNALLMAMLSLRSLPKAQRQAWQALFNHYIFEHDDITQDHLPNAALGMLEKPLSELSARQLRADLQNKLKR